MERLVSYERATAAIDVWRQHAQKLERERDEALAASVAAQLEAARLRDELRRRGA